MRIEKIILQDFFIKKRSGEIEISDNDRFLLEKLPDPVNPALLESTNINFYGADSKITHLKAEEKKEWTIGRNEDNYLMVMDQTVSRYHAKIHIERDYFLITDLDSANGTKVNGKSIKENKSYILDKKMELKFGEYSEFMILDKEELYKHYTEFLRRKVR